ncbi:MAG: winged helix-turn-helix domain-containing protein [archaeon]
MDFVDLETMFTESKWKILTELAKSASSPSQLAKSTGTSVANISVQLKLLEAMGFVRIEKLSNISKGEPRKLYSLNRAICYMILSTSQTSGKKLIELEDDMIPYFSVWLLKDNDISRVLIKYLCSNEVLQESSSLGYLGLKDGIIELVALHPDPAKLHELSERNVSFFQKNFIIQLHSHSIEDFRKGFENKEEYFNNTIKRVFILKDRDNVLSKMKKGEK